MSQQKRKSADELDEEMEEEMESMYIDDVEGFVVESLDSDEEDELGSADENIETIFVYFSVEAMEETGEDIPNLLSAQKGGADEEFQYFEGTTCVEQFLDWVLELSKQNRVIAVAHNLKGHDGYMVQ